MQRILYRLYIAYYLIRRHFQKDKNIYLIYTMGKCGSATVAFSLKKKKPYTDVIHVHFLSKEWLSRPLPDRDISLGKQVLDFLAKSSRRLKIITMVREPVSRTISALFQTPEMHFNDIEKVPDQELVEYIKSMDYGYPEDWFKTEFFNFTNIDILKLDFDTERGYSIYHFHHADVLCIKLEKLNQAYSEAFKDFAQLDSDVDLALANQTENTSNKNRYLFARNNVKLDRNKLQQIYSSEYVRHFYSDAEINGFISHWSGS